MNGAIRIVECPRDAMQGMKKIIPTQEKIDYINSLLKVGFHTIDCGSCVSAKAIPQLADTAAVIDALEVEHSLSKLLVIVANERGAEEAATFEKISFLGFPLSLSETFQRRNTNAGLDEAKTRLYRIMSIAAKAGKKTVTYLSMAFGNPYGDPYDAETVLKFAEEIRAEGAGVISIADTVGLATPVQIADVVKAAVGEFGSVEIGVHLHASAKDQDQKLKAALDAGCRRFDGALKGFGGCPMSGSELVGNIDTEKMIAFFEKQNEAPDIDRDALKRSSTIAAEIFA